MRLKEVEDNGNITIVNRQDHPLYTNSNNRNWLNSHLTTLNNINNHHSRGSKHTGTEERESEILDHPEIVCNEQYLRTNQQNFNFINFYFDKETGNLENTEVTSTQLETLTVGTHVSPWNRQQAKNTQIELSNTDEMTEASFGRRVPRGIVNPNYPGFQHLAHTLQNYSSNLDNSYHSENDLTDDDADIEITEISCDTDLKWCEPTNTNINNNNVNSDETGKQKYLEIEIHSQSSNLDNQTEVPDLLKTISKHYNNNSTIDFNLQCTDSDIENNFHTEDIIGNFNKEVEDEIKLLLNYNINIQDDLEELRKDIKETFAKPIENTINNISDVVNHVIKRLVESQDSCNQVENKFNIENFNKASTEDSIKESNAKDMILSRPSFLLIEDKRDNMIIDAFLSDGKDEININENNYNTEFLCNNIEQTINQLSSELRKIIPKLDEMRQHDKFWEESNKKNTHLKIDGNFNEEETASCSTITNNSIPDAPSSDADSDILGNSKILKNEPNNQKIDTKKENWSNFQNAQNPSILQNSRDCSLGSFDVYTIETELPLLDIDTIENHLKAAKEAERRKLNDREEIRRRLAMGVDCDEYYEYSMGYNDRPGKKPSLHSRLQSGKNLQICFMNETASDNESHSSGVEKSFGHENYSPSHLFSKNSFNNPYQTRPLSVSVTKHDSINTLKNGGKLKPTFLSKTKSRSSHSLGHIELKESDFYALQATLQTEARIALAQAKEMARIQMERERRSRAVSPVTEMLRRSMEKANAPLAPDRRRVSRQLLTDMNIAQLQVIVNELHSQIESLNETLVKLLMQRDELHMGQDSMLVDIEDLTRYLGVKEQSKKTKGSSKSGVRRLTSLVHK